MFKKIILIFLFLSTLVFATTAPLDTIGDSSNYNFDSASSVEQISIATKQALDSTMRLYKNLTWMIALMIVISTFYTAGSTYFRLKTKEANGMNIPMLFKFQKIISNTIITVFISYFSLGIFALTFADYPYATQRVTISSAWEHVVFDYFNEIFATNNSTNTPANIINP